MGSRQSENNITRLNVFYNVNEIPPSASAASAKNFGNSHNEDNLSAATAKCVLTDQRLQWQRKLLVFCRATMMAHFLKRSILFQTIAFEVQLEVKQKC